MWDIEYDLENFFSDTYVYKRKSVSVHELTGKYMC